MMKTMKTMRHVRQAFTLTELLVVIIIMVIVVSIALPGFRSMIDSSQASRAQTVLQSAMKLGRAAAVRSAQGEDIAVVFFYTPARGGGRYTLVPCVKVGEVRDETAGGDEIFRDVFVPTTASQPLTMPKGWMIRAYAPVGSFDAQTDWYGDRSLYPISDTEGNWVFPETNFYTNDKEQGHDRQTFMVRFAGGVGTLVANGNEALVLDPVLNAAWRGAGSTKWENPDTYAQYADFVRVVLRKGSKDERRAWLGGKATDMILARPVVQLALYEEAVMAAAVGARIDRDTGCIYHADTGANGVTLEVAATGSGGDLASINHWLNGDTNLDGTVASVDEGDAPQAIMYVIDQYRGTPMPVEVQP